MMDRRTYLAGQSLHAMMTAIPLHRQAAAPEEMVKACLSMADTLLGEIQRTCEHQFYEYVDPAKEWPSVTEPCQKCGLMKQGCSDAK